MASEAHFTSTDSALLTFLSLWDSCPELFVCCPASQHLGSVFIALLCHRQPRRAQLPPAYKGKVQQCHAVRLWADLQPQGGCRGLRGEPFLPAACLSSAGATELKAHGWLWEPQSAGTTGKQEQCETGELSMHASVLVARCSHHLKQQISHIM